MNVKLLKASLFLIFNTLSLSTFAQCLPTFSSAINYFVNAAQNDIVSADFNADGNVDVATANFSAGCVVICCSNANGTFTSITNYTSNILTPARIKSADFNGDNIADLVMTNSQKYISPNPNGNIVSILLGNGNGSFDPATNFTVASNSYEIITEDFNSDNKIDLVLTNGTNAIQLLLSTGGGNFSPAITFTTVGNPFSVVSKDFNGDGFKDLALPGEGTDIGILLSTGTGSFITPISISTFPKNCLTITSNDFNNDGVLDLVVETMNTNYTNIGLNILLGTGTGSFVSQTNPFASTYINISDIETGDFNNDGNSDLIYTMTSGTYPELFAGFGNATFFSGTQFSSSLYNPRNITLADFNHDSKLDVAFGNYGLGTINYSSVFMNNTFFPPVNIVATSTVICVGETVTLTASGATNFTWNTGDTTSNIIVRPLNSATYNVLGRSGSCSVNAVVSVSVQMCLGIQSLKKRKKIILFPNPIENNLFIESEYTSPCTVILNNGLGKILLKTTFEKEIRVDLSIFPAGIYFLNFKSDNELIQQEKVIIR